MERPELRPGTAFGSVSCPSGSDALSAPSAALRRRFLCPSGSVVAQSPESIFRFLCSGFSGNGVHAVGSVQFLRQYPQVVRNVGGPAEARMVVRSRLAPDRLSISRVWSRYCNSIGRRAVLDSHNYLELPQARVEPVFQPTGEVLPLALRQVHTGVGSVTTGSPRPAGQLLPTPDGFLSGRLRTSTRGPLGGVRARRQPETP